MLIQTATSLACGDRRLRICSSRSNSVGSGLLGAYISKSCMDPALFSLFRRLASCLLLRRIWLCRRAAIFSTEGGGEARRAYAWMTSTASSMISTTIAWSCKYVQAQRRACSQLRRTASASLFLNPSSRESCHLQRGSTRMILPVLIQHQLERQLQTSGRKHVQGAHSEQLHHQESRLLDSILRSNGPSECHISVKK